MNPMLKGKRPRSVLFACADNSFRSPMAEGVMRSLVGSGPLAGQINIASAGLKEYKTAQAPDTRAQEIATNRGYSIGEIRCRQVITLDFTRFDLVVTADSSVFTELRRMSPPLLRPKVFRLLEFIEPRPEMLDIPAPTNHDPAELNAMLDLIEKGCKALLNDLQQCHGVR